MTEQDSVQAAQEASDDPYVKAALADFMASQRRERDRGEPITPTSAAPSL